MTFGSFNKYILFLTLNVCHSVTNFDACIYNGNIIIIFKNFFHFIQRDSVWIKGKILIFDHIIDITPYCIQWYIIFFIFLWWERERERLVQKIGSLQRQLFLWLQTEWQKIIKKQTHDITQIVLTRKEGLLK